MFEKLICDLKKVLRYQREIEEDKLLVYLFQIGEAVEFLHEHKILYRDLKPDNTMLDKDGAIKICDFGISKLMDASGKKTNSCTGNLNFF